MIKPQLKSEFLWIVIEEVKTQLNTLEGALLLNKT